MRAYASIPMKVSAGFAVDPDPSTSPASVPPAKVFNCKAQLTVDGTPNALQVWLDGAAAAETVGVEVWGLDDGSNINADSSSPTTQVFVPNANQKWAKLVAAQTVTAPIASVFTGRAFPGYLYVRQTGSTLTAPGHLKVAPAPPWGPHAGSTYKGVAVERPQGRLAHQPTRPPLPRGIRLGPMTGGT